jgi:hypothetical protein
MNPTLMNQRQTDLTEEMKVRKEDNQIEKDSRHNKKTHTRTIQNQNDTIPVLILLTLLLICNPTTALKFQRP